MAAGQELVICNHDIDDAAAARQELIFLAPPHPPPSSHPTDDDHANVNASSKTDYDNADHLQNGASDLDWEEACHANPRFEVLLMCHKECANRR